MKASTMWNKFLNFVIPKNIKCVLCECEIEKDNQFALCDKCRSQLPYNDRVCRKCGVSIRTMSNFCETCGNNQFAFDQARSVCRFSGQAKQMVYRLKFGGQKYMSQAIAALMVETLERQNWDFDEILYVPISKTTKKVRGYNQACLLTEKICDIMNLPFSHGLEKVCDTVPQEELTYAQRFENVSGVFKLNLDVKAKKILVVDDVKTTGATFNEIAKLLKNNGADKVYCLSFASNVKSLPTE